MREEHIKHVGDLYLDGTDVVIITELLGDNKYKVYNQLGIESIRSLQNTKLIATYKDVIKTFEVKLCGLGT